MKTPPDIPAPDLARALERLNGLEVVFRPLARRLTPEMEPAPVFRPGEEPA